MPYLSRTDLATAQLPFPLPVMGPAGSVYTEAGFGNRILRVTDGNLDPANSDGSYVASATGSADIDMWSKDSLAFMVDSIPQGDSYPVVFDPSSLSTSLLPSRFKSAEFSRVTPGKVFELSGTQITEVDMVTGNTVSVCDFASVLPVGFIPMWRAHGGVGGTDEIFAAAFGSIQDAPAYVCTFRKSTSHFRLLNNAITGYGVHNVKLARSGDWLVITAHGVTDSPYFWQVGTVGTITKVNHVKEGGHWSAGYKNWVNNNNNPIGQYTERLMSNPSVTEAIITSFPPGLAVPFDQHSSWNNARWDDLLPFLSTTTDTGVNVTFPAAWYNEVIAIDPMSGVVNRFCHTFNSSKSPYFSCAQAIGSVSQDGKWFTFTSDWMGTLGTDSKGNPRSDVFLVELR